MPLNLALYAISWLLSGCVGLWLAMHGLTRSNSDVEALAQAQINGRILRQAKMIRRSWRIRGILQGIIVLLAVVTVLWGAAVPANPDSALAVLVLEFRRWCFTMISVLVAVQSYFDIRDFPGEEAQDE